MIEVPVEVKEALKDGRFRKEYFIDVYDDNNQVDFTIDNDHLVAESVSIDERLDSGDLIKFGLCEGASLEFQYFDKPNIYNRRLKVTLEVEYLARSKDFIETEEGVWHPYIVEKDGVYTFKSKNNITVEIGVNDGISNYYTLDSSNDYQMSLTLVRDTRIWVETHNITVTVTSQYGTFDEYYPIPMGFFTVKKCSRASSTGIMKVTAYNKLQSDYLDRKANDDIIAIAQEGVAGTGSEVNVGVILDRLLDEYTIKRSEFMPPGTWELFTSITPSTVVTSKIVRKSPTPETADFLYVHVIELEYRFYPNDYSLNNIYRLSAKCKAMYKKTLDWFNELPENVRNSEYRFLPSEQTMILQDAFANGAYRGVNYFGYLWSGSQQYYNQQLLQCNANSSHEELYTDWALNVDEYGMGFVAVPYMKTSSSSTCQFSQEEINLAKSRVFELFNSELFVIEESAHSELEKIRVSINDAKAWPDVTLRELQSAVYESQCQYGQLDRITDLFYATELNGSRLYPAADLYPADDLYPDGASLSATRSMYSELFADEGNIRKWRYLNITYKALNGGNEEERIIQRTVNEQGTDDYNMSDNWLFRNLIWADEDVGELADVMVIRMRDIVWFPFELRCSGLPYIETGDEIEVNVNGVDYPTYILQRELRGIHNLEDTYINGTLDTF